MEILGRENESLKLKLDKVIEQKQQFDKSRINEKEENEKLKNKLVS